jgi:hypothetical protein
MARLHSLVTSGVLVTCTLALAAQGPPVDVIKILNNDDEDLVTVVARGRRSSGCVSGEMLITHKDAKVVNFLAPQSCPSEVAGFAVGHGMALTHPVWRDNPGDAVDLDMGRGLRELKVTAWMVFPSSLSSSELAARKAYTIDQIKRADQLFNTLGCGIRVRLEFGVAKQADDLVGADCSRACLLRTRVGFDDKAFNLYHTHSTYLNGEFCGGTASSAECPASPDNDQVGWFAKDVLPETAAHEIGHALSLRDNSAEADSNLMSNKSANRRYITLGQCYAANLDDNSGLNRYMAGMRHPDVRDCDSANGSCLNQVCVGACAGGPTASKLTQLETTIRDWLECDHCSAETLATVAQAGESAVPILTGRIQVPLSAEDERRFRTELRRTYRALQLYDVDHPEWAPTQEPEDAYVERYLLAYRASIQLRAVEALGAMLPKIPFARQALTRIALLDLPPRVKGEVGRHLQR